MLGFRNKRERKRVRRVKGGLRALSKEQGPRSKEGHSRESWAGQRPIRPFALRFQGETATCGAPVANCLFIFFGLMLPSPESRERGRDYSRTSSGKGPFRFTRTLNLVRKWQVPLRRTFSIACYEAMCMKSIARVGRPVS